MNAGRGLDALVAEKVMGWRPEAISYGTRLIPPDADKEGQYRWEDDSGTFYYIPNYSTDLADAWEVLSHIVAEQHLTVAVYLSERGSMVQTNASDPQSLSKADTTPHAICLAALAATGAEVPA